MNRKRTNEPTIGDMLSGALAASIIVALWVLLTYLYPVAAR